MPAMPPNDLNDMIMTQDKDMRQKRQTDKKKAEQINVPDHHISRKT